MMGGQFMMPGAATDYCLRPGLNVRQLQQRFLAVLVVTVVTCILLPLLLVSDSPVPHPHYVLHKRYITVWCDDGRRLGNLLFNYASLLGIARRNNMTAVLPPDFPVRKLFRAKIGNLTSSTMGMVLPHREYGRRASAYDVKTSHLPKTFDIRLYGYYQSWKYFENVEAELREDLTLLPDYQHKAQQFFAEKIPKSIPRETVVKVGIHVRRGDQLKQSSFNYGYITATKEYFQKAMEFMKSNITGAKIFIVCTDDYEWTRKNVIGQESDTVIYSNTQDAWLDFAILASCDHTIVSVGSFGWWAGWVAGGKVTYFKDWPRKFTRLEYDVNKNQYFPPHWIPL